jgi:uncharacterized protein
MTLDPSPGAGDPVVHELAIGTAWLAGFIGSTHCVVMCGGIATALGTARGGGSGRWQPLLYQLGRITSYGVGGALVGALGAVAGLGVETSRWNEVLRLGGACVVVLIGLKIALGTNALRRWLRAPERWGALLWRQIAPAARGVLPAQPFLRALTLGLIWGWLPCGLVYSVLLVAAFANGAARGAAIMMAFGLGTLPAMLGLSYAGARLIPREGALTRLSGAVIVACGLWTAGAPITVLTGAHHHNHPGGLPARASAARLEGAA